MPAGLAFRSPASSFDHQEPLAVRRHVVGALTRGRFGVSGVRTLWPDCPRRTSPRTFAPAPPSVCLPDRGRTAPVRLVPTAGSCRRPWTPATARRSPSGTVARRSQTAPTHSTDTRCSARPARSRDCFQWNGVRMSGSTGAELESDAGPDTDRLAELPSGNQTMSPAVLGDISNPTIPVPSGAMKDGALEVLTSRQPFDGAAPVGGLREQIGAWRLARVELKTIR